MDNVINIGSRFVKPFVWVCVFLSSSMLLNLYDAESFLLSFLILAAGAVGTVLYWPRDKALTLVKSPVVILLYAFWALAFVSAVFSEVSFTSFIFFCFLGTLPLSFLMCAGGADKDRFFKVVFRASSVFYAALSILCLLQYFFMQDVLVWGLTSWPMANPNSLAGFLSLGFFCSYGCVLYVQKPLYRCVYFLLSLLIITAMYTTGGRGALLSLVGGFSILMWLVWGQVRRAWVLHVGFVLMAVLAFILMAVFAPEGAMQPPHKVLHDSLTGQMPLMWSRFDIWGSAWAIVQDHFWLGTGIGTFSLYYPEYRAGDISTSGHMVHNDVLQFWLEMGVLAPVLFFALMGAAIVKTIAALNVIGRDSSERILIAAPFCAFGALVLHTQISFHFYILPTLFVMGTLLSFWFVRVEHVLPSRVWVISKGGFLENSVIKFCVLTLILCCSFLLLSFQGSEVLLDRAKDKMRQGDVASFSEGVAAARAVSFGRNARALALASVFPSRAMREQEEALERDEYIALYRRAEGLLDDAIRYNPRLASSYHEKALIVEHALMYFSEDYSTVVGASTPSAQALLETALRLNPLHSGTRVKLAQVLLKNGGVRPAYEVLKAGLGWSYYSPKALGYFQMLSVLAAQQGEDDVHVRAVEKASTLRQNIEDQKQKNQYMKSRVYLRFLAGSGA